MKFPLGIRKGKKKFRDFRIGFEVGNMIHHAHHSLIRSAPQYSVFEQLVFEQLVFEQFVFEQLRDSQVVVLGTVQSKYTQVCSYECKHPSWLTSHAPTGREELHHNVMKPCDISPVSYTHLTLPTIYSV